jgi:hypothetical protein
MRSVRPTEARDRREMREAADPQPHTSLPASAYVSIRQHTSAYVSIRQHTSAYVLDRQLTLKPTPACQRLLRQHLHFCTSKVSKLSTWLLIRYAEYFPAFFPLLSRPPPPPPPPPPHPRPAGGIASHPSGPTHIHTYTHTYIHTHIHTYTHPAPRGVLRHILRALIPRSFQ